MARRLPPLNALRAFEAAARQLNFINAANELAVTPSAVSHQIKTLEDWAGIPLFRRDGRHVALTEAAQSLGALAWPGSSSGGGSAMRRLASSNNRTTHKKRGRPNRCAN